MLSDHVRVQADIHRREDDLLETMPAEQRRVLRSVAASIAASLVTPPPPLVD
jgi:hypothetical protein